MELTQEEKEKLFKKKQETKDLNNIEKSLYEIKQILKDKENINVIDNKDLEELRKQLLSCYNLYKKIENSFEERMNLLDEKAKNLSLGAEDIKTGISEGVKASAKEVIMNDTQTSLEAVKTSLTSATDKYVKEMEKAHEKANKSVIKYVWLNRLLLILIFASMFVLGYIGKTLLDFKTEIVARLEVVEDRETFIFNRVTEIKKILEKKKK